MARIYGLNGALRGKQGNNVFSIQSGTQVVKAYQPVVGNPRTAAQQIQRTKFALAGKISGFTPAMAVAGMPGTSVRARRGALISNLVAVTSVSANGSGYLASIPFASMLFSLGGIADYGQEVTPTAVMGTSGTITVNIPALTKIGNAPAGYGELAVCGMFDTSGSPLDLIQVNERSLAGLTFRFHLNVPTPAVVAVFKCPFARRNAITRVNSSNVGVSDDNTAATLSTANSLALSDVDWGNSVLMGTIQVAPSREGDEPLPTKKK